MEKDSQSPTTPTTVRKTYTPASQSSRSAAYMLATKALRQAAQHAERTPLIKFIGKRTAPGMTALYVLRAPVFLGAPPLWPLVGLGALRCLPGHSGVLRANDLSVLSRTSD